MAKPTHKNKYEKPDPTPVAIPVRFKRSLTEFDRFRNIIRDELSRQAASQGFETFEEADDFDVGDDYDPSSPWELEFDPTTGREMLPAELEMLNQERKKAAMDITRYKKKKKAVQQPLPLTDKPLDQEDFEVKKVEVKKAPKKKDSRDTSRE